MKNRVLLLLMIILCVASLGIGCAPEDIIPKESANEEVDALGGEREKERKEEAVAYEIGWLALSKEYYAENTSPLVLYAETYEEFQALLDQEMMAMLKDGADEELPWHKEQYELTTKYTEEYFETKELIIAVWYQENTHGMIDYRINSLVSVEEEGAETTFCLSTELYQKFGIAADGVSALRVYAIEIDKSLGINPENLTFEVIGEYT